MIQKKKLEQEYIDGQKSAAQIAKELGCSETKVHYWLRKHNIKKRSISDALYVKHNPNGDPFSFQGLPTPAHRFLYGLGLGLYWGEGNKRSPTALRLGNTDPDLIRYFLDFLQEIYHIDTSRLRFGLQIFSDIDPEIARRFWCKQLHISPASFQSIVVTPSTNQASIEKRTCMGY